MKKQITAVTALFFIFSLGALFGQTSSFNPPKSNSSVRDILEGHQQAPSNTYYLMALSAARKGDHKEAFKAINTGLRINSTDTKLLDLKAALLARQGELVKARRIFMLVINLDPRDNYAKGCLEVIEKTLQPVRHSVDQIIASPKVKVITESPVSPVKQQIKQDTNSKLLEADYFVDVKSKQQCYHNMSLIKRAQDSRKDKERKTTDKDLSPEALVASGYLVSLPVCPKGGFYKFSNKDIQCSVHGDLTNLSAEVTNVFTEFNKGMQSKMSRNYLDALKSFEQVVILYPKWGEAHFQLADTLSRLGETDSAITTVREALRHDPKNTDAELLLANQYFKKGMKLPALKILDRIAVEKKGSVYAYAARSIAKSIRSGRSYYELFPPR